MNFSDLKIKRIETTADTLSVKIMAGAVQDAGALIQPRRIPPGFGLR
jgi:hypothetical protein